MENDPEELLSIAQAAKVVGMASQSLWNLIQKGKIKAASFCIGGRNYHGIPREEVDRLLREMQPPGWAALEQEKEPA